MILKWGGYAFDDDEVWFSITRRAMYSPRGRRMWTRHTWVVTGVKIADDVPSLTAALTALEVACLTDGQDLLFYDNTGAPTSHGMFSSGTLNGVQVVAPVHYPGGNQGIWGTGTEYTNKRTYQVTFQADVFNPTDDLVFAAETITKIGNGGPLTIWQESLTGLPQLQQVKTFTKCRMIQQGNAIGLTTYPTAPGPLYGYPYMRNDLSMYEEGRPRKQNINVDLMFPIRWRYVFEGPTAF